MKSRLIMNLVLLAIIAVLGVVAFLKPGKQKPETPSLLTLDASALTRMTLQNKETLVFEKQDGAWRLTAPFVAPVNQVRAGQLLEVAKARSEANYPLKPEDVAQFGLDKPQAILTLGDATLQFGGTDPINMRRYVRLGDTLHLVDDNFFHHLTAPATDYVDKKLLPEGAKIRAIELPGSKATKSPEGQWAAEPSDDGKTNFGELASSWATARAIDVKRLDLEKDKDIVGETIRIGLAEGAPVEFVVIKKQPDLILARKDLGLKYEMTSETSRELLNLPKPPPPAPAGGKPGEPNQEQDDDDDRHEGMGEPDDDHDGNEESGGDDSGHDHDEDGD
ncbi:MAG: DUF4340 domain-containing protein [Methylococcaceae bacterium]|nr:DUF4340 domain-containing protein [Methylococcaceae bacterium]